MRVMSNIDGLGRVAPDTDVRHVVFPGRGLGGLRERFGIARQAAGADVLHIDCDPYNGLWMCLLLPVAGARRTRLVLSDLVLQLPSSAAGRLAAWIKKLAFRRVDRFLLVQHDFAGYTAYYGMDAARVRSLPFKVNSIELIATLPTSDEGYLFAGGSTHRDWPTLAAAVRGLDMPVRLGISDDGLAEAVHVTAPVIDGAAFPDTAMLIRHPPRPIEWLRWVAGCRVVCLPIRKESLNPSGISTYLSCMALGKCVIISDGPAVKGFLDDTRAVIVPPGDPQALREAIDRANRDAAWREGIARRGQEWAQSLGGEDSYYRALLDLMGAAVRPDTGGGR